jgi:hypothetical protein
LTIGKRRGYDFGKCVKLREVKKQQESNNITTTDNIIIQKPKQQKEGHVSSAASPITTIKQFEDVISTRIITIRVTEPTYSKFREHSRMYHNVSSYEDILNELLDFYAKHHEKKYFA